MLTPYGHLTYCTNIHPGESWADHFAQLQHHIPLIKQKLSPGKPLGIGLRLSNIASLELRKEEALTSFKAWLKEQDCYVFTMNGFPYGGFHRTRVKDDVHTPDWTTGERVQYTIRLAQILAALLPDGMEGGISTSPLSYKHWHNSSKETLDAATEKGTMHVLHVAEQLIQIKSTTGKSIHLDIEPEPDGILENSKTFFDWYEQWLMPLGVTYISEKFSCSDSEAQEHLKNHVQLCYDVCHFAIGYEEPSYVIGEVAKRGIKIGKIQISAALKSLLPAAAEDRKAIAAAFQQYNEPTYLHQVIARNTNGSLKEYRDLPEALEEINDLGVEEWRAHFHVPLFADDYGVLQSTQKDIEKVMAIQKEGTFSNHMEIETYTWEVLPAHLKLPMTESIIRELEWVSGLLK